MIDPVSGEEVKALVPCSATDRQILAGRRFREDGRVRCEIKNPRHAGFHRLVHAFGKFLAEHVESFERHVAPNGEPDAHAALKDVQTRSGAACDRVPYDIDIKGFGVTQVTRMEPRSISFDEMDEDEFSAAFAQMVRYIADNHYPGLTVEKVKAIEDMRGSGI